MKKYKVFLSNNTVDIDGSLGSIDKQMADECEEIENLINSDYQMQDSSTAFGELHSISEVTNYNTQEKNLLTVFQKEINNVDFILQESDEYHNYELSNKELKYINDFKKVIIDNKKFIIQDISYDLSEEIIKVIIKSEE